MQHKDNSSGCLLCLFTMSKHMSQVNVWDVHKQSKGGFFKYIKHKNLPGIQLPQQCSAAIS